MEYVKPRLCKVSFNLCTKSIVFHVLQVLWVWWTRQWPVISTACCRRSSWRQNSETPSTGTDLSYFDQVIMLLFKVCDVIHSDFVDFWKCNLQTQIYLFNKIALRPWDSFDEKMPLIPVCYAIMQQAWITWANVDLDLCCHKDSLGHIEATLAFVWPLRTAHQYFLT